MIEQNIAQKIHDTAKDIRNEPAVEPVRRQLILIHCPLVLGQKSPPAFNRYSGRRRRAPILKSAADAGEADTNRKSERKRRGKSGNE